MSASRLAGPLAASVFLHLVAAGLLGLWPVHTPGQRAPLTTLTVRLAESRPLATPPLPIPVDAVVPEPPPPPSAPGSGDVTHKARFLVPPNLSTLETIPVTVAGSLSLRLRVSANGQVADITVVRADPIPDAMLDGILAALRQTRLEPARAGTEAVASDLDMVIRYEPSIPLDH